MTSILAAINDVFASVAELIWSFISTALDLVQKTLHFFLSFVHEIFALAVNFFRGLVDLAGGIFGFVLGNILMLGVVSAGVFGFLQYQRRKGKEVTVGGKKVN